MNEEKRKILDMLAQGKITVDEADRLLAAIGADTPGTPAGASGRPAWKYLRVQIEPGSGSESGDRVNIRVPYKLIKAGLKFASFIPREAQIKVNEALREKGMDFDLSKISFGDLEEIVANLDDMTVEVDGQDKVRIFCE